MSANDTLLIKLSRDEIQHIVNALTAPDGLGNEIDGDLCIATNIMKQVNSFCISGTKHRMIQPDDSENIKWGEFGVCEHCNTIRKMEDV